MIGARQCGRRGYCGLEPGKSAVHSFGAGARRRVAALLPLNGGFPNLSGRGVAIATCGPDKSQVARVLRLTAARLVVAQGFFCCFQLCPQRRGAFLDD